MLGIASEYASDHRPVALVYLDIAATQGCCWVFVISGTQLIIVDDASAGLLDLDPQLVDTISARQIPVYGIELEGEAGVAVDRSGLEP